MNNRYQVGFLLLISIVVMCTLSVIQFYLVNNTYQLTKEKYFTEVKREIGKIIASKQFEALGDSSKEVLKRVAHQYVNERLDKPAFFKRLSLMNKSAISLGEKQFEMQIRESPYLHGVQYKSQFDEIVLEINGHSDTLLAAGQQPFLQMGNSFNTVNTFKLSNGNTYSTDNERDRQNGNIRTHERFKLHFLQSEHVDVSAWKAEVFKRIFGIFSLAVALIIGVITVFFLVFRAMIKQKKMADIKTDFANNITHELKTPLSSAGIIFKSLNRSEVHQDPRLFNELLKTLERQFNKIQHTVDSVLDSAITADINVEMQETEITGFLIAYVKNQMIDDHQLISEITDNKVIVKTNIELLEKVLDNMLQNAVKYSNPGSIIRLKSALEGHLYSIAITDNGPGIAKTHQQFIFEKFYRIPEQNLHTVKGLGLGLYLAKQTITLLKGTLTLNSMMGVGSTFTIKLPVDES